MTKEDARVDAGTQLDRPSASTGSTASPDCDASTRDSDGSGSEASASTDSEAAFEAWAYSQAKALPPWWPHGERGEQAARFMAAAMKFAWTDGFDDERVRHEHSAWRHAVARQLALRCEVTGAGHDHQRSDAVDPHAPRTSEGPTRDVNLTGRA